MLLGTMRSPVIVEGLPLVTTSTTNESFSDVSAQCKVALE